MGTHARVLRPSPRDLRARAANGVGGWRHVHAHRHPDTQATHRVSPATGWHSASVARYRASGANAKARLEHPCRASCSTHSGSPMTSKASSE